MSMPNLVLIGPSVKICIGDRQTDTQTDRHTDTPRLYIRYIYIHVSQCESMDDHVSIVVLAISVILVCIRVADGLGLPFDVKQSATIHVFLKLRL